MYLVVPPGGCFTETRRIELGAQALSVGRSESCDIRVDVPGVDPEHAKISEIALVAVGQDCAVGDVPLDAGQRRLLVPGDEIQLGSIVLAVEGSDPSLLEGSAAEELAPPAPRVRVVEGKNFGDELLLAEEGREYALGRGASCDLVLDDREVSREHVKLTRRGFSVFVRDMSSTRGSWLGRSAVYTGSSVEWTRPRMLRVGATVLSLELPEEARRVAPGAQASAPMHMPPKSRPGALIPPDAVSTAKLTPVREAPPAPSSSSRRVGALGREGGAAVARTGLGSIPPVGNARQAWKSSGVRIGKFSGILLLGVASLAILGALFVVFSLLE